jgi:hypothetical protein
VLSKRDRDSTTWAVSRFMLGSLVAIAVVLVGGFVSLRGIAIRQAERDTRSSGPRTGRRSSSRSTSGSTR